MKKGKRKEPQVLRVSACKINEEIRHPEVRVVGENIESGVYPTKEALKMAKDAEMDLVEITPNAKPPVCRITDYSKYIYEQKKRQKELNAKQIKVVVKEVRFGPNTDEHDFNFKLKHAQKFLEEGAKVKAFVFFKGRAIAYKERGQILLLKFAQALEDYGVLEAMPKLEGKKMIIFINAKKTK